MQVCEQRDPGFWAPILSDPDVAPSLFGQPVEAVVALLQNPAVLPLATRNGGLLFISRCGFGRVHELHTAYTRAGWGREVHAAAKEAFRRIFGGGALIVFTYEYVDNWRTRPPKSFGFRAEGEPFTNEHGQFQLWLLSRAAWEQSPAAQRYREVH